MHFPRTTAALSALALLTISSLAAFAANECASVFSTDFSVQPVSQRTSRHAQSFIAVLDYALTKRLISLDVVDLVGKGSIADALIKVEKISNFAELVGMKEALHALLLRQELQKNWSTVQIAIQNMVENRKADRVEREGAKENTRNVIRPRMRRYPGGSAPQKSSQWHVTDNGDVLMATSSYDTGLVLYNLRDLDHPVTLNIGTAAAIPTWHLDKNGESLIAAGNFDGAVYVYDLNDLAHPRKFIGGGMYYSPPTWHVEPNGDILIAIPSHDGFLYIFELDQKKYLHRLQIDTHGKAIQGEATWENSDGMKSRIAVPTRDQKIYIFDLDVPKQPIILKVAENGGVFGMSAPLWWHSAKGETFIFVGGLDKLSRFDLRDATHPAKFTIPAQTAHHLTLLTLANGKTVVAVATWDGKIYLFDPEDLDHPSILDTKIPKGRIDENPTLVITPDQRMFLAVAVYDQGVFVFDLADTENPIRMPIGRTFTSAPAWHTAPSGDIYLSVGDAGGNLYVTTFYSKSGRK